MDTNFLTWAAAGYAPDLVSVIPPNSPLAPGCKLDPTKLGKTPGYCTPRGWRAFTGSRAKHGLDATVDTYAAWTAAGATVGIMERRIAGIDLDITDPAAVAALINLARKMLGPAPLRTGSAPKGLLLYRWPPGFALAKDLRVNFADGQMVEIRTGKFYINLAGTHPKTGAPHVWDCDSPPHFDSLTEVTEEQVRAYIKAAGKLAVAAHGFTLPPPKPKRPESPAAPPPGSQAIDDATYHKLATIWLSKRAPAIARDRGGGGHHHHTFATIAALVVFQGASVDRLLAALLDGWNDTCDPPSKPEALRASVTNAMAFPDAGTKEWDTLKRLSDGYPIPSAASDENVIDMKTAKTKRQQKQTEQEKPDAAEKGRRVLLGSELAHLRDLFIDAYAKDFRCSPELGWLNYTAERGWIRRDKNPAPLHAAIELIKALVMEGYMQCLEAKELRKVASTGTAKAVLVAAGVTPQFDAGLPDTWDCEPFLLNTPGGLIDLRTGAKRDRTTADKHLHCTAVTPVDGPTPVWDSFILRAANNRPELAKYLEQIAAMTLTGHPHELLFFGIGEGGNGKDTLFDKFLKKLLGDYAAAIDVKNLLSGKDSTHDTAFVPLHGARLVLCTEIEKDQTWREAALKKLTGGNSIPARHLYHSPFSFRPTHKLVIYANEKPMLKDIGRAMRRRLRLIPFDYLFTRPADEPELSEQLWAEAPQILHKLVALLAAQDDLTAEPTPPQVVLDATAAYFDQADVSAPWFNDCCILDPAGVVSCADLHASYIQFVGGDDVYPAPPDQATLMKLLLARPGVNRPDNDKLRKIKGKVCRVLLGLRLRTPTERVEWIAV